MDRKIEKKHQWVKKVIWISFGFVFCGFIIYNIFFGDKSSKLNVQLEKLSVSRVKNDVFQDYIAVIGIVQPIKTIYLDATEGGKVEEILIEEGTMVDTDDVIIRLSNNNLLLEISNNEAQVARAINDLRQMKVNLENQKISTQTSILDLKYSLKQLKRTFTNNRSLYENDHISKEEFELSADQYELAVKKLELLEQKHLQDSIFMEARIAASENSVESMQNNLSLIRNRLEALHIKAPVKGELAT
ncbi:MAG: HlyD family secretion protein, partial [Bacteroidota bacterium]